MTELVDWTVTFSDVFAGVMVLLVGYIASKVSGVVETVEDNEERSKANERRSKDNEQVIYEGTATVPPLVKVAQEVDDGS